MFSKMLKNLSLLDMVLIKCASTLFGVALVGIFPQLLNYGFITPLLLGLALGVIPLLKAVLKAYDS